MSTGSSISGLRRFEYAVVDVFAEQALEGNMLAIFTDARGLSDAEMQALARETNLAETTFVLPGDDEAAEQVEGVHVRIFTTQEELPFAGHPTLGTASWLYRNHATLRGAEAITLRLKGGAVTVRFRASEAGEYECFGTMRQHDPVFGEIHDADAVARATGIALEDMHASLPIQTVSTGLPFCIVPLRSIEALERLQVTQVAAQAYLAGREAKFFYVIAALDDARDDAGSDVGYRARMQFYNGEDPATGSAAGCAISYLVHHGAVASEQEIVIRQGIEIRRPSCLYARASRVEGRVTGVFVSGSTIPVASGYFSLA